MNRRNFFASSAGLLGALGTSPQAFTQPAARPVQPSEIKLAGMSLSELHDKYRRDLFDVFLPFMDKYIIDHEFGGFMCNTDYTGKCVNDNKLSWFEGRGTWVYAFLYNNLAREQKYLEVARRSIEFVLKAKPQSAGELWPKELTRDGKPITQADGELYGDLFIAEGLAEFSKATGEKSHWDDAKKLVLKCVRISIL